MYGDILITVGATALVICALLLLHIVIVSFVTPLLEAYSNRKTKERHDWEAEQEKQIRGIFERLEALEKIIKKNGGSNQTP